VKSIPDLYCELIKAILKISEVIIFPTSEFVKYQFPLSDAGPTYRDQTHLYFLGSMFFSSYYQSYFDQQNSYNHHISALEWVGFS
tara:strand:- start:250 stop:504 length:255 start_codon:yes stop_codon:yes gene_type:complete